MNLTVLLDKLLKKINKEVFNEEDIRNYINSLIDYLELNDYYKGLVFLNESGNLASYSFETFLIKINLKHVEKIAFIDYKIGHLKNSKILFINLSILETIYHEIMHVFQNYVFLDSDFPFRMLYAMDIIYLNSLDDDDPKYDIYYNSFIIEREATITAFEQIIRILSTHIDNKEIYNYFLENIKKYMKLSYTDTSPIEKLYKDLYKLEVPIISNIDLYDRIKFGFQVTEDEWNTWTKNENDIILKKLTC